MTRRGPISGVLLGIALLGLVLLLLLVGGVREQQDSMPSLRPGSEATGLRDSMRLQGRLAGDADLGTSPANVSEAGEDTLEAEFLLPIDFLWLVPDRVELRGMVESTPKQIHMIEMPLQPEGSHMDVVGRSPIGGRLYLEVFADGEVIRATPIRGTEVVLGSRTVLPEVRMGGPAVRGRVVDGRSKQPVSDVEARLFPRGQSGGSHLAASRTGMRGLFRLEPTDEGPWEVRLYPPREYATPAPVVYERVASEPREIVLRRLCPVRVRPLWRGEPISPLFLHLSLRSSSGDWLAPVGSDDAGVIWVPPGEYEMRPCFEHAFVRQVLEVIQGQRIGEEGLDISPECLLTDGTGLLDLRVAGAEQGRPQSGELIIQSEGVRDAAGVMVSLRLPLANRLRMPMQPGRYCLQGGRVADGQGFLTAWFEFQISPREATVADLGWTKAVRVKVTIPSVGNGLIQLRSSPGPAHWMDASSPHDEEARLVPQEESRVWGGREVRLFVLPGAWTGWITKAGGARTFLIDAREGEDAVVAPWD